jgi:hypothetical protein
MKGQDSGGTMRSLLWIALGAALLGPPAWSQQIAGALGENPPPASQANSPGALQLQLNDLRQMLIETRGQVAESRAETAALRKELAETRQEIAEMRSSAPAMTVASAAPAPSAGGAALPSPRTADQTDDRLARLEDDEQLLTDKVNEQYQTKVESASKYRVRLSGIVLTNAFANRGSVDNQDIPTWANPPGSAPSNGSVGATLRQSELGLEVYGPKLAGAATSASVRMDFAGGFPSDFNGVTSGIMRLRTATFRMDWPSTSVIAGQDALFFSPLSPTSLASLAVPALAYAGNLWTWTPQIRVEHRVKFQNGSTLALQGGVLDPLTGEFPSDPYFRSPTAGESSKQPAYAGHLSWSYPLLGRTFAIGAGGYYSRQDWSAPPAINSWAITADWMFPLASRLELSGEFYRGNAVGGLGGGIGQSVVFIGNAGASNTVVRGVDSEGGWTQLKFRATDRLEFNGAVGDDNPFVADLRLSTAGQAGLISLLTRNQVAMGNFIYRPRSDLLFSVEYKYLRTSYFPADEYTAGQLNLTIGVLF